MEDLIIIPYLDNSTVNGTNCEILNLQSDSNNFTYSEFIDQQSEVVETNVDETNVDESNVAEEPVNNPLYNILEEWKMIEVYEYLKGIV